MGTLPTFISTAQAPSTTGVGSLDFVPLQDDLGKQLQNLGGTGQKIAEDMFKTINQQAVNEAKLGASLKLNALEVELGNMDPQQALRVSPGRIQTIYEEQSEGLSSIAKDAFDATFSTLNAQSRVNIQAQAVKNHNDKQQAGLVVLLDGLSKNIGPKGRKITTITSLSTAFNAIDTAVSGRVIKAEEGEKLKLKFRKTLAENEVGRWFNGQTRTTLIDAYAQMDNGKFKDAGVQAFWNVLDENKKRTLTAGAITSLARLHSFEDKAKIRLAKADAAQVKGLMLDFYNPKATDADRTASLNALAKNPEVNATTFASMLRDQEGRTTRFTDYEQYFALMTKIFKSDEKVTESTIINNKDLDIESKKQLIGFLNKQQTEEMNAAQNILRSHPEFMPANKVEKLLNADKLDRDQAQIWVDIQIAEEAAKRKGTSYDAIEAVKKAIKDYGVDNKAAAVQAKANAVVTLNALKIKTWADLDTYIANTPALKASQIGILKRDASLAFGVKP